MMKPRERDAFLVTGRLALAALMATCASAAVAQTTVITTPGSAGVVAPGASVNAAGAAPAPSAPSQAESARYVESCQQGIEHGVVNPGCQGPIYASEIARLKEDALRTNNPNLLTLVGEAYQSPRGGLSDIAQAYRWYLLAAVRGDPLAIQRLSNLYKDGRGAPRDNIKALGYARLSQRLALPGSSNAKAAAETISVLGSEMADEEVALAERFADELERKIQSAGGTSVPLASQPPTPAAATPGAGPKALSGLPGMSAAQPEGRGVIGIPPADSRVPGLPAVPEPQRQP